MKIPTKKNYPNYDPCSLMTLFLSKSKKIVEISSSIFINFVFTESESQGKKNQQKSPKEFFQLLRYIHKNSFGFIRPVGRDSERINKR